MIRVDDNWMVKRPGMAAAVYEGPCGRLLLGATGSCLVMADWMVKGRIEKTLARLNNYLLANKYLEDRHQDWDLLEKAIAQLDEYFRGERRTFDVPLKPVGTEFQMRVWEALQGIPYGTTTTYKAIAEMVGRHKAVRAVANAIGANALSVFIPCHRVLGVGDLGGYAGGIEAKRYLLALEKGYDK